MRPPAERCIGSVSWHWSESIRELNAPIVADRGANDYGTKAAAFVALTGTVTWNRCSSTCITRHLATSCVQGLVIQLQHLCGAMHLVYATWHCDSLPVTCMVLVREWRLHFYATVPPTRVMYAR